MAQHDTNGAFAQKREGGPEALNDDPTPCLSRKRTIVLATLGTLGDLYPFIAIALALKKRGWHPVLAVSQDHVRRCQEAGVEAVSIHPGFAAVCDRMGLGHREAVHSIVANQRVMLEQVLLADLPTSVTALDALCRNVDAIVSSIFVFAAEMIAEKLDLPLVSVVLQPMAMLLDTDPPHTPDFWMVKRRPNGPLGRAWNRAVYSVLRGILQQLYGRRVDAVRATIGLAPRGAARLLEPWGRAILRLGCYSPVLGMPDDSLAGTRVVGFPMFDGGSPPDSLPPALVDFLAAGAAPLVFTLGTFVIGDAKGFYVMAEAVARRLGMRAVLLTGEGAVTSEDHGIFRCPYAAHSVLFPAAAIIVQHGGVGTTGQALRAGKPQLVVPHMGDQYDHAYRIQRLGAGLILTASRFTVERAANRIRSLMAQPAFTYRSTQIAKIIALEDGASDAANAIETALANHHDPCLSTRANCL